MNILAHIHPQNNPFDDERDHVRVTLESLPSRVWQPPSPAGRKLPLALMRWSQRSAHGLHKQSSLLLLARSDLPPPCLLPTPSSTPFLFISLRLPLLPLSNTSLAIV